MRWMWCKDVTESVRVGVVSGVSSVGVSARISVWRIGEYGCGFDCDFNCDFDWNFDCDGTGNRQTSTFLNAVSDAMVRGRVWDFIWGIMDVSRSAEGGAVGRNKGGIVFARAVEVYFGNWMSGALKGRAGPTCVRVSSALAC